MGAFGRGGLRALGWGESVAEGGAEATLDGDVTAGVRLAHHHRALTWSRPPVLVMRALTFGPPVFETPIARIEPDADVLFGLLLYVSAADPRGVSRDELSRIIWPSATTEQGRHSLRQALYRLRQLGVPIHLRAGQVSIEENDTEIDLRELLHGPIDRSDLVRIGTQSFLPGYSPQLGRAYLEWVDELRDRAASVRRRALAAAIVDARAQARFGDIPELARALLALDPLNETATLSLAEALVMDGSKVDALMLLDRYESEVGEISEALRIPVRTLRRRVSEGMDEALMPLRFEVPFVGRVREFGELRDAWSSTRRNVGQCAVVTGEAGIGKTRTSTELLRLAVLDGGLVVTYACGAGDTVAPLSSLLGLTGMLLNQPGALGCGQEHLNYLRRLLHPDPQQPLSSGMTADLAYAQLVYSLSELVAAITEEAPLVIFIDDAHRLHQTSWRIFTDVTNRLPERSLLLLLAARQLPEFYPTLGITSSDGRVRHVRLPSMGYADAELFLERWSERNRVPFAPDEVARFTAAAAGNPFYLGELAAHRGRGGADDAPPATIRGLIELQFAALREHAQRVLLVVSLLQTHATLERVTRVLELTPMEFLSALEELEQAGLVATAGATLGLRHESVGDILHALASPGGLHFMRLRTARVLEIDARAERDPEILATACRHLELAGAADAAAGACNALGHLLLSLGLAADAVESHRRACSLADSEDARGSSHLFMARALYSANSWPYLADAAANALPNTPLAQRIELALYSASGLYFANHQQPDAHAIQAALVTDGVPAHVRSRALHLAVAAWDESFGNWQLPLSEGHLREAATPSEEGDGQSLPIMLAAIAGDTARVEQLFKRVAELPGRGDPALGLRELRHAANAFIRVGASERAWAPLQQARTGAERLRLPQHEHAALLSLAQIAAHQGSTSDLRDIVSRSRELASGANDASGFRRHLWILSQLALLDDDSGPTAEALALVASLGGFDEAQGDPVAQLALRLFIGDASVRPNSVDLERLLSDVIPKVLNRGALDHLALAICTHFVREEDPARGQRFWEDYRLTLRRDAEPPTSVMLSRLPRRARLAV